MMLTWTIGNLYQLAEDATTLADWLVVRRFAHQIYGEQAVKVDIDTYGQYNDEGGSNYYVGSLTAYDKDDNELNPDYSLPFFQTEAGKTLVEGYKDDSGEEIGDEDAYEDDEDYEADEDEDFITRLKNLFMSSEEQQRGHWLLIEDLPCDNGGKVYDLTTPPLPPLLLEVIPSLSEPLAAFSESPCSQATH
jgi:hypothetical protein